MIANTHAQCATLERLSPGCLHDRRIRPDADDGQDDDEVGGNHAYDSHGVPAFLLKLRIGDMAGTIRIAAHAAHVLLAYYESALHLLSHISDSCTIQPGPPAGGASRGGRVDKTTGVCGRTGLCRQRISQRTQAKARGRPTAHRPCAEQLHRHWSCAPRYRHPSCRG